jgi:hypothetical protein
MLQGMLDAVGALDSLREAGPLLFCVGALSVLWGVRRRETDGRAAVTDSSSAPNSGSGSGERFFQTIALLRRPSIRPSLSGLVFLLSLLAFAGTAFHWASAMQVGLLVAVLFVHEGGHWAAMRLFGYRDVRVFFIPFIGAATAGIKEGAPAWQRAVVALMGPLPGLVFSVILLASAEQQLMVQFGIMLLLVNGLNLAPFEPLDGGRFVNTVFFTQHPRAGAIFGGLGTSALALAGFAAGIYIVGLLALWLFAATPLKFRAAGIAQRFRQRHARTLPLLPARIADASDHTLRDLYEEVDRTETRASRLSKDKKPGYRAALMRTSYEIAILPPMARSSALIMSTIYVAAVALTIVGTYLAALHYR